MAKAADTAPKDKGLEADILSEAAKVGVPASTAPAAGSGAVNQDDLKTADTLGANANTGANEIPAPETNPSNTLKAVPPTDPSLGGKTPPPPLPEGRAENASSHDWNPPDWFKQTPPTIEEMDAMVAFLGNKREETAQAADPTTAHKKIYGNDFILAKNKTGEERPFTRLSWTRMGGNQNIDGWREVVKTPQEVKNLQAKK